MSEIDKLKVYKASHQDLLKPFVMADETPKGVIADYYASQGFAISPGPVSEKAAVDIQGAFAVQLGTASGGIVEVKLCTPEAVKLAAILLPATEFVFGTASSRNCSWIYKVEGLTEDNVMHRFLDQVQVRGDGEEAMFPGALDGETNEQIQFADFTKRGLPAPTLIKMSDLTMAAAELAVAALLLGMRKHDQTSSPVIILVKYLAGKGWSPRILLDFLKAVDFIASASKEQPYGSTLATRTSRRTATEQLAETSRWAVSETVDEMNEWIALLKI